MSTQDVERDATHPRSTTKSSDSSSESAQSIDSYSESTSLLHPDLEEQSPNYKSTEIVTTEESGSQDEDSLDNHPTQKSVFAILSLLLIGVFISNADGTLVLATYGTISSDFGAFSDASWLTTSFSLAVCAAQPITGKLSDIYGRKGVLLTSYVLFAAGSVICGIAASMWQVIAGRIVSGVGAAGMTVIVSVLITDLVPLIQVASWRSYVNVISTLGRSIGGPLGGFLADTVGWRWSFIGQGPIIALAILLVALKLPSNSSPTTSTAQVKGQPSKLHRIDFIGAFTLAITVVALLGALSTGGQTFPWSHPLVIGPAVGSLVLGTLFVVWEVRYAVEPVFPPSLVIKRDVATAYAIMALQTAAQLAMMFSVPLYFRATQGATNTAAGSHLFPAVLGNTAGGLIAGFTIQKTGCYKYLTIFATLSSALSYLLLILRWHGHTGILESLYIIPGGFGCGMAAASTFIALTSSLPHSKIAMATGGMYMSSSIGMTISIAISSSVQLNTLRSFLTTDLRGFEHSAKIIEKVVSDVGVIAGLDGPVKKVVVAAYVKSLEYSHMVSLSASLLALGIAFTMREHKLQ